VLNVLYILTYRACMC